MIIKDRDST